MRSRTGCTEFHENHPYLRSSFKKKLLVHILYCKVSNFYQLTLPRITEDFDLHRTITVVRECTLAESSGPPT